MHLHAKGKISTHFYYLVHTICKHESFLTFKFPANFVFICSDQNALALSYCDCATKRAFTINLTYPERWKFILDIYVVSFVKYVHVLEIQVCCRDLLNVPRIWPITIPFFAKSTQIGCFFGKISQNTPNFTNWTDCIFCIIN